MELCQLCLCPLSKSKSNRTGWAWPWQNSEHPGVIALQAKACCLHSQPLIKRHACVGGQLLLSSVQWLLLEACCDQQKLDTTFQTCWAKPCPLPLCSSYSLCPWPATLLASCLGMYSLKQCFCTSTFSGTARALQSVAVVVSLSVERLCQGLSTTVRQGRAVPLLRVEELANCGDLAGGTLLSVPTVHDTPWNLQRIWE